MYQRSGLKRLTRLLARELPGGELAQLVVHQRQEQFSRRRIPLFDFRKDPSDVVHGVRPFMQVPAATRDYSDGRTERSALQPADAGLKQSASPLGSVCRLGLLLGAEVGQIGLAGTASNHVQMELNVAEDRGVQGV